MARQFGGAGNWAGTRQQPGKRVHEPTTECRVLPAHAVRPPLPTPVARSSAHPPVTSMYFVPPSAGEKGREGNEGWREGESSPGSVHHATSAVLSRMEMERPRRPCPCPGEECRTARRRLSPGKPEAEFRETSRSSGHGRREVKCLPEMCARVCACGSVVGEGGRRCGKPAREDAQGMENWHHVRAGHC